MVENIFRELGVREGQTYDLEMLSSWRRYEGRHPPNLLPYRRHHGRLATCRSVRLADLPENYSSRWPTFWLSHSSVRSS